MPNRYSQILRSYPRWAFSNWAAALYTMGGLFFIFATLVPSRQNLMNHFIFFAIALLWMGLILWGNFAQQIKNESRWLLPNYLLPQLTVFAVLSVALIIAWPMALAHRGQLSAMALVDLALAYFALMGITNIFPRMALIAVGAWFLIFIGESWMSPFLHGSYPHLVLGILLVSALTLVAVMLQLILQREARNALPHFFLNVSMNTQALRPRLTGEVSESWNQAQRNHMLGWPSIHTRIFIPQSNTLLSRALRWRQANAGNMFVMFMIAAMMFIYWWKLGDLKTFWGMLGIFTIYMPIAAVSQMWLNQWRFLEIELLRPMQRQKFLREIGVALALDLAQCASIFVAAMIVGALTISPEPLTTECIRILAAVCLLIFGYGLILWLMRYRSNAMVLACSALLVLLSLPVMFSDAAGIHRHELLLISASLAIVGLGIFIARDAYQRWMAVEWG